MSSEPQCGRTSHTASLFLLARGDSSYGQVIGGSSAVVDDGAMQRKSLVSRGVSLAQPPLQVSARTVIGREAFLCNEPASRLYDGLPSHESDSSEVVVGVHVVFTPPAVDQMSLLKLSCMNVLSI